MTRIVERLEQALRFWEDGWHYTYAVSQWAQAHPGNEDLCYEEIGPIKHWRELRSFLRQLVAKRKDWDTVGSEVVEKFINLALIQEMYDRIDGYYLPTNLVSLPVGLAAWTMDSRRVFQVSEDLQILLEATSLKGVRWKEVHWPFNSFAIIPAIPLQEKSGAKYDCVLVSRDFYKSRGAQLPPHRLIRLFSSELGSRTMLTESKRDALTAALKKRKWSRVKRIVDEWNQIKQPKTIAAAPIYDANSEKLVTEDLITLAHNLRETVSHAPQDESFHELANQAARLIVGLCLYLNTLPPSSPHASDWTPSKKTLGKPDPNALASDSLVCAVSTRHKLTARDREQLDIEGVKSGQRAYHELRAHFRSGHWRRPPGRGSDPTAARTVQVEPTIVRRDRLRPGELPSGATSDTD